MVSSFSVESFGCNINDNKSNQGSDLSHTIIHNITKKCLSTYQSCLLLNTLNLVAILNLK